MISNFLKPKSSKDILASLNNNYPKLNGNELLFLSAYYGFVEGIKKALELGIPLGLNNDQSIRSASAKGHFKAVKFLIEKGANINARSGESIVRALNNDHFDVAKLLIDNGINTSKATDHARIQKYIKSYKYLMRWKQNQSFK